jgi:hypothetical protein
MTTNAILGEALDQGDRCVVEEWALLLIAFVVGGAVALWLVRRHGGLGPSDDVQPSPLPRRVDRLISGWPRPRPADVGGWFHVLGRSRGRNIGEGDIWAIELTARRGLPSPRIVSRFSRARVRDG